MKHYFLVKKIFVKRFDDIKNRYTRVINIGTLIYLKYKYL